MPELEQRAAPTREKTGKAAVSEETSESPETQKKPWPWLGMALLLVVGVVLFSPALLTPLFLDDFLQGSMVEGTFPAPRSPFNLYDFVGDGTRATLIERGLLPWWTHPQLTIRFFRPLASALLWVDHRVFAHAPLPMHVHSLAWWVAAVLAVRALYTRFFSPRVTLLASVVFALAPCHALPLAWVANRETLVTLVFGALALAAQARWREKRSARDAASAGAFFALALLGGGEYALCLGGYVVAMDAVRREGIARRFQGWAPFLVPAVAYLAVRHALGYGTAGSGFYSDPLRDSGTLVAEAPWRAVALLANGWLTIDALFWRLGVSRWLLAGIVLAAAAGLVVPVRRMLRALPAPARGAAIWLLMGSVLALAPTLAVVPSRRLLGVSMMGIAAAVALLLDRAWFPAKGEPLVARGRGPALASLAAMGLGFVHLVHGPGLSWLASQQHRRDASEFVARAVWLRERVGAPGKARVGVLRGTTGAFFAPYALDRGGELPRLWCTLAEPGHVLALRRDARTLDLVAMPGRGLFPHDEHNLYRSPNAPFAVGDQITAGRVKVTILEVGEAGPRSARFVFDVDPDALVWLNETYEATREVSLPNEGFGEPFDP